MTLGTSDRLGSHPPTLCITGMHRSGTSLVSSLLQNAGLDIGQEVLGPGVGNVKGHFEDLDFFNFHVSVLRSRGLHESGFTLQGGLQICEQHLSRAKQLIADRRLRQKPWGWKDPRTTLFLDFWGELIPEANFVLIFRAPWEVMDSLFRRGDEIFRTDPSFAARVWTHYNRLLLDYIDRFPTRCICANSYRVAHSPSVLLDLLAKKFGVHLGPIENPFDGSLYQRLNSRRWASLLQHHFPDVIELYQHLNDRADESLADHDFSAEEPPTSAATEDWVFQNWLELRMLEKENQNLKDQCRDLRKEMEGAQQEIRHVSRELDQTRSGLATLHSELELAGRQLAHSQKNAMQIAAQLSAAQEQLSENQEQLNNMKTSKFWKLRTMWFGMKAQIRRAG